MKIIFIICLIFPMFSSTGHAVDIEERIFQELEGNRILEEIPEELRYIFHDYNYITSDGLTHILQELKEQLISGVKTEVSNAWRPAVKTLMIVLICGIIWSISPEASSEFPILFCGIAAIVFVCLGNSDSYFKQCVRIIAKTYDFATVLLPTLAAASVASGATISSGVKYTAAVLFMNLILNFSNTVLVPLIKMYVVCKIGDALFQQPILGVVSNVIRWGCISALSTSVLVFTAYLKVAGIITENGELLATKITQTTLSNGLPVVGRIISDAASTLVAGASTIRNGIGLLGMLVIISILLGPLISAGVRYFIFRLVGECSQIYSNQSFKSVIVAIGDSYGMLFAIIGTDFIVLFLILLSFMQVTGGGL